MLLLLVAIAIGLGLVLSVVALTGAGHLVLAPAVVLRHAPIRVCDDNVGMLANTSAEDPRERVHAMVTAADTTARCVNNLAPPPGLMNYAQRYEQQPSKENYCASEGRVKAEYSRHQSRVAASSR